MWRGRWTLSEYSGDSALFVVSFCPLGPPPTLCPLQTSWHLVWLFCCRNKAEPTGPGTQAPSPGGQASPFLEALVASARAPPPPQSTGKGGSRSCLQPGASLPASARARSPRPQPGVPSRRPVPRALRSNADSDRKSAVLIDASSVTV